MRGGNAICGKLGRAYAFALALSAILAALPAGNARAAGFPNGKYTFKSLASPGGLYPAGYFTFNVDISIKNTDAAALWITNCLAPITREWYPRMAEAMGAPPSGGIKYNKTINIVYESSGNPATHYISVNGEKRFSGTITFPKSSLGSSLSYKCGAYMHEYAHSLQQDRGGFGAGTNDGMANWLRFSWYEGNDVKNLYAKGHSVKGQGWISSGYDNCSFFEAMRERYVAEHPEEPDKWVFLKKILYAMRTGTASTFCTETFGMTADALKLMWKNDYYLTGVANPSMLSGADAAAMTSDHVLDLGGATKNFCGSLRGGGQPILIDGTVVKNGVMNVYPLEGSYGWWSQRGVTYTVGQGATFHVMQRGDQGGQINFQNGTKLVIDGGYVRADNNRGYGHYVGCDSATTAQIDIRNGGKFRSTHLYVSLGDGNNSTGVLSVTNGTFEVSENDLRVVPSGNGTGRLLMDGGRLVATSLSMGYSTAGGLGEIDIRNSTLAVGSVYVNKAPKAGSYARLDGVTVVPNAEGTLFSGFTASLPLQVGEGGVAVSNIYDVASTAVMSGSGSFTKRGAGTFTFNGVSDFAGDINLQQGTVSFGTAFRKPSGGKVVASGGTTVSVSVDSGFRASTTNLAVSVGSGTVSVEVAATATVPIGTEIAVFRSLGAGTALEQLAVPSGYAASLKDGGVVFTRVETQSGDTPPRDAGDIYWCGAPLQSWNTDNAWLLDGEAGYFQDGDRLHFDVADSHSVVSADSAPSAMHFTRNGVVGGAGSLSVPTVDVSQSVTATIDAPVASALRKTGGGTLRLGNFTGGKALDVEAGTVQLTSASAVNPLSTAKNANVVKGVLDLGGASQTFHNNLDGAGFGLLQDGGEIRNGTFNVTPVGCLRMEDTTFTVGAGADLVISQADGINGCLGLRGGARLVVAGGSVVARNADSYGYVGCDQPSSGEIRIIGGGAFRQNDNAAYGMRVGWNGDSDSKACATGVVSVAGGAFDLSGTETLSLANGSNAVAVVAVTNGTLKAGNVVLCETEAGGLANLTLKDSTAFLDGFSAANEPAEGSSVLFDGATLVPGRDNPEFLPDLAVPVTIGAGGLVVSNDCAVAVSAPFEGTGAFTKTGGGVLTLETSRSEQTTVAEGTLRMADEATLDGGALTLGVAPGRAASLDYAGQALAIDLSAHSSIGTAAGGEVSIDNADITIPAVLRVRNGSLTLGSGARVTMEESCDRWVCVGGYNAGSESATDVNALLAIDGGAITNNTGCHLGVGDFGSAPSKGTMVVRNGGSYWGKSGIYVAQGCEGHLVVDGAGSSVMADSLFFCGETTDAVGENGYVVLTNGGVLAVRSVGINKGLAEGYLRFDGGTLRAMADGTLLASHDRLHYEVGAAGGEIDNGGFSVTIGKGLTGGGTVAFTGAGTTTLGAGACVEGSASVASGTTLGLSNSGVGTAAVSGTLSLAEGSKLSFSNPSVPDASLSVGSISVASPVDVEVEGVAAGNRYPLISGVGSVPPSMFRLVSCPVAGTLFIHAGTLYLGVGMGDGFVWTGSGADALWGTDGNWMALAAPSGECEPRFLEDFIVGSRTARFGAAESFAGVLWIDAGTAAAPLVFAPAAERGSLAIGSGKYLYVGQNATEASLVVERGMNLDVGLVRVGGKTTSTSRLTVRGSINAASYVCLGVSGSTGAPEAVMDIDGGAMTNAANDLVLGDHGPAGAKYSCVVRNGGEYVSLGDKGVRVSSRASGTLAVTNGAVKAEYGYVYMGDKDMDGRGVVVLGPDALLSTKRVTSGDSRSTGHELVFDGGTLRAAQDDVWFIDPRNASGVARVVVKIGASGGTIDTNGKSVAFRTSASGEGGLAVAGGGELAFNNKNGNRAACTLDHAGTTTVVAGTAIRSSAPATAFAGALEFAEGAKLNVGTNGLAYTCICAADVRIDGTLAVTLDFALDGELPVLTRTSGVFADEDCGKVVVAVVGNGTRLAAKLSADGKSICIGRGPTWPENWNGGRPANDAMQAAFDAWAAAGNDATALLAEEAFLMGVDVQQYVELKAVSVSCEGGSVAIAANADLTKVRGRLYVAWAATPGAPEKDWKKVSASLDAKNASLVTVSGIDEAAGPRFFKLGVGYGE